MDLKKSLTKRLGPRIFPRLVHHVHGPVTIPTDTVDLVVVSVARDAARYLPTFIAHHLGLGATHLVLLDNDSDDDTVAIARRHERVTVLTTRAPFRHYEAIMRRYLIDRFGQQRWCLYVDVDELFDYPESARLPLPLFLGYLNHYGYTAVVAQMLDMFADRPLQSLPQDERDLRRAYPLYDIAAVERAPFADDDGNERANEQITRAYGGIRKTFLGVTVLLSKHPLLFNDGTLHPFSGRQAPAHSVTGAQIADISCLLRHYKLIDGFYDQAAQAARSRHYGKGDTRDYESYLQALDGDAAQRNPAGETAQKYTGVEALAEQGFLQVTHAYRQWVRERAGPA